MRRALAAGHPRSTLELIEGMNHVLKAVAGDRTVQLPSYGDPTLPLHPRLPEVLATFLPKRP